MLADNRQRRAVLVSAACQKCVLLVHVQENPWCSHGVLALSFKQPLRAQRCVTQPPKK